MSYEFGRYYYRFLANQKKVHELIAMDCKSEYEGSEDLFAKLFSVYLLAKDKDHPFSLLNEDNNLFFKEDNKMGLFEPKFTLMQQAHIRSKYIDKLNDLMLSIDYLKAEEDQYVLIELPVNEKDSTTGNIPKQLLILYRDGTIFALSKRLDNTFSLSDRSVITEFLNREEGYLTDYFVSSAYYTNYPDIKRNSNIKRSH